MSASPQYYERIDETFEEVESKLEELESDPDIASAEGVLNVTFSNGVVFVLSRQPAVEQLWLATPGGGFHFVWRDVDEEWFDTKTNEGFRQLLSRELSEHTGEPSNGEHAATFNVDLCRITSACDGVGRGDS